MKLTITINSTPRSPRRRSAHSKHRGTRPPTDERGAERELSDWLRRRPECGGIYQPGNADHHRQKGDDEVTLRSQLRITQSNIRRIENASSV